MSGVYIKGMKMPKNCRTCKLIDYDRGCYRCIVTTAPCDPNYKNENYPLVYIPPHGRCIDADALCKDGCGNCYGCPYDVCIIANAPTIIPAEEGE